MVDAKEWFVSRLVVMVYCLSISVCLCVKMSLFASVVVSQGGCVMDEVHCLSVCVIVSLPGVLWWVRMDESWIRYAVCLSICLKIRGHTLHGLLATVYLSLLGSHTTCHLFAGVDCMNLTSKSIKA